MARQVKHTIVRPLKEREELLVLDVLFEQPLDLGGIADSISQKVDGPDVSKTNLLNILVRLGSRVRVIESKGVAYYCLSWGTYKKQLRTELNRLLMNQELYDGRISELIRAK